MCSCAYDKLEQNYTSDEIVTLGLVMAMPYSYPPELRRKSEVFMEDLIKSSMACSK